MRPVGWAGEHGVDSFSAAFITVHMDAVSYSLSGLGDAVMMAAELCMYVDLKELVFEYCMQMCVWER